MKVQGYIDPVKDFFWVGAYKLSGLVAHQPSDYHESRKVSFHETGTGAVFLQVNFGQGRRKTDSIFSNAFALKKWLTGVYLFYMG